MASLQNQPSFTRICTLGAGIYDTFTREPLCQQKIIDILSKLSLDGDLGGSRLITSNQMTLLLMELQTKKVHCESNTGGSGANTAMLLSHLKKLFPEYSQQFIMSFCTRLGNDNPGNVIQKKLADLSIKTIGALDAEAPTHAVYCLVDERGERTMLSCLGATANYQLTAEIKTEIEKSDVIIIEGYFAYQAAVLKEAIAYAKSLNKSIVFDFGSYQVVQHCKTLFEELIPQCDLLFCNTEECNAFLQMKPSKSAIHLTTKMGVKLAIITDGANGAYVASSEKGCTFIPTIPIDAKDVVDTTGAGDAFKAGFLFGRQLELDYETCAKIGHLIAGYMILNFGTQLPDSAWREIQAEITKKYMTLVTCD